MAKVKQSLRVEKPWKRMMQLGSQHRLVGINKGCLQKPRTQTRHQKPGYFPHVQCSDKLESWLRNEEAKIDRIFYN